MAEKKGILSGLNGKDKTKVKRVSWGAELPSVGESKASQDIFLPSQAEEKPRKDVFFEKIMGFAKDFGAPAKAKELAVFAPEPGSYHKQPNIYRPPQRLSEEVSYDLKQILQRSNDESEAKSRMLQTKHEIDKILISGKKYREDLDQPIDEEPSQENLQDRSDKQFSFAEQFEQLAQRSSKVVGLLHFLNVGEEPQSPSAQLEEAQQQPSLQQPVPEAAEPRETEMSLREETPPSPKKEAFDFDGQKRSRQSYFPEKLLRRAKPEAEVPTDPYEVLVQEMKGPLLGIYNTSSRNMRFADCFNRLNLTDSDFQLDPDLHEQLEKEAEFAKSVHIESMLNFAANLENEFLFNEEILGIKFMAPVGLSEGDDFESSVRKVISQKLLVCLNMATRIDLLKKVGSELDQKLRDVEQSGKRVDELKLPHRPEQSPEVSEEQLLEPIARMFSFQYFKLSTQSDSDDIVITFSIADSIYFSLNFARGSEDCFDYYLANGLCRPTPVLVSDTKTEANPLCNPAVIASLFSHLISSSISDSSQVDSLHFLTFIGYEYKYLTHVRKSLGLIISRHKVSDALVNSSNYSLQFLLIPRMSRFRCTLRITVGLLLGDKKRVAVDVLSSNYRKRNIKEEAFSDLNQRIEAVTDAIDIKRPNWLFESIDVLAKLFIEGESADN